MKKYFLLIIPIMLIGMMISSTGCKKSEISTPMNVTAMPDSGIRGQFIYFAGQDMNNIVSVIFGGNKSASINSTYNTETNLFVNIPTDATFGKQTIILTNKDGNSTSVNFKVVQPKPFIKTITPISGISGDIITITGSNFANITKFTLGGVAITAYTIVDENTIKFTVPTGVVSGALIITTAGGVAQTSFGEILLTDFDGNGVCPTWDSYSRGTGYIGSGTASYSNVTPDPIAGLFVKLSIINPQSDGWVGFNPRGGTYTTPFALTKTADKIYFNFDANPGVYSATTRIRVTITANTADGTGVGKVYTKYIDVNWAGWKTTSIQLSTIGYDYGSTTPVAGTTMINPLTITKVDFAQVGVSGTLAELSLDNIKLVQVP